ncbi:MAG: hypothetical protein ACI4GZ_02495 [Ruminococcus sp.]
MLTVLTLESRHSGSSGSKLKRLAAFNTLRVKERSEGNLKVRHIRYIDRRGKVNWKRIKRAAVKGSPLVYSGSVLPNREASLELFSPLEYRSRLCENMALTVLESMKSVPKGLKVGVYDPKGDSADLCRHILRYTDNLVAVTANSKLYEAKAEEIMWETGATLVFSRRPMALNSCGLIIAPHLLDRRSSFCRSW